MMGFQLNFGIFALVGLIMLVLAGASFGYIWWLKDKSKSSWMLQWFFLCVSLSAIATILTNSGLSWSRAFAPAQDAFLFLGGVFLVQFAYTYPIRDQQNEATWVTNLFMVLALAGLGYAAIFAVQFIIQESAHLQEYPVYYYITPVALFVVVLIFFRRSLHWSGGRDNSPEPMVDRELGHWGKIARPQNLAARALRNFGLALSLGLIPVIVIVMKPVLPALLESFLFNFGVIMGISAIMLVYLNFAPEPTTILARLVGISLVTVLLILGLSSVWFYINSLEFLLPRIVLSFMSLVLLSSALITLGFPLFLRTTLIKPLDKLLQGTKAANQGNLDVEVPVQYDDEIGFLTESFNHLLKSLRLTTQALMDKTQSLEEEVIQRTFELRSVNEQLQKENTERRAALASLDRQLGYEQALAGCSKNLLSAVNDSIEQNDVMDTALEQLRVGAQASRAYIFRNIVEGGQIAYMGMYAEVCAPDIPPQIDNPINQKFSWAELPAEMCLRLEADKSFGGPIRKKFASTPDLVEIFLNQEQPLLSILCLPIFIDDRWWGFIGFDECLKERDWDDQEILMLRTAAEMIGNTLQRWQAEDRLRNTLELLEQRVQERTMEYARINAELRYEINERQIFQKELEERLEIEMIMARISARLIRPTELRIGIQETLADLGQVVQAKRVAFFKLQENTSNPIADIIDWHAAGWTPLPLEQIVQRVPLYPRLLQQINSNETVFIDDLTVLPESFEVERSQLNEIAITSLLLVPVFVDDHLAGTISFTNMDLPKPKILANLHSIEVIASMLASLLRREEILNVLEEKVSERTRQLSAFFDMAMLASEAQHLVDFMQPALIKVMEIIACEAATIHLYDEDKQAMLLIAHYGISNEYIPMLKSIPVDRLIYASIRVDDNDNDTNLNFEMLPGFELPGFRSTAYTVLRVKGNIQGLMSCHRKLDHPFDAYQKVFLNAIGEQLGLAVENYRLRLKAERAATIQERQRLARELHDAVSQSLYSLTLYARSGRDALTAGDRAKLSNSLQELETNSLIALKEMRLLLYQLRSLALEEKGLVKAIESRFDLVERRSGVQAKITMDTSIELPETAEQELFLLITEALNNALKHAQANMVSVSMQKEYEYIILEVQDNGIGFNPAQVTGGMGLMNMRERAASLGGRIEILDQRDHGTRIRLEIPQQKLPEQEVYIE